MSWRVSANNYNDEPLLVIDRQKKVLRACLVATPFIVLLVLISLAAYFTGAMTPVQFLTNPAVLLLLAISVGLPSSILLSYFRKQRLVFFGDYVMVGRANRQRRLGYDSLVLGARDPEMLRNGRGYAFKLGIKGEGKHSVITLVDQVVPKIEAPSLYHWLENKKELEYNDDLRQNKKITLEQSITYTREMKLITKILVLGSIVSIALGIFILVELHPPMSSPLFGVAVIFVSAGGVILVFGLAGYIVARSAKPMPRDSKGNPIWNEEDESS